MKRTRLGSGGAWIFLGLGLFLSSAGAWAADRSAGDQVEILNKRAMEDYDLLEFTEAKKTLLEAVALIKKNKIDDELAVKTYIDLGVVYVAGLKDRIKGLAQFVKALQIDPKAKLDPALATPELQQVFENARDTVGLPKGGKPAVSERPRPPAPVDPSEAKGLIHKVIDEAPQGRAISIRALLGSDIMTGRVYLSYRPEGHEDFVTIPMTRKGGETHQASIPANVVAGRALQYYIEVEDPKGRLLASSGGPSSPNLISLISAEGQMRDQDETAIAEEEAFERRPEFKRGGRFFLVLGLGSGFGWATGNSELEGAPIQSGVAPALALHVSPEFGFSLSERFAISVQGRLQFLTMADPLDPTKGTPASGAIAVLLRGHYYFSRDAFRGYATVAIGGGEIRHTVSIGRQQGATDTVVAGPVFAGPGIGFHYDFSPRFGLMAELQVLVGYSDFTANLDGNFGFIVRL